MKLDQAKQLDPSAILKVTEAAKLVGTTPQAMRLRISRGTLETEQTTGARGKPVTGVRVSVLLAAYSEEHGQGAQAGHSETHAMPHTVPHPPASDREAKLEETLRNTQSIQASQLAQVQAKSLSRELQAFRHEAQVIREEAKAETQSIRRAARRDSLMAAGLCIAIVGGVSLFAWGQLKGAANSTVLAQGKTIEAMGETQAAQKLALEEATKRAQVEGELAAKKAQLAATEAEAKKAQQQLEAIALGQRIRAGIAKQLRAFR